MRSTRLSKPAAQREEQETRSVNRDFHATAGGLGVLRGREIPELSRLIRVECSMMGRTTTASTG